MSTDLSVLVGDNLDIWVSATDRKSRAGRGGGKSLSLYGIEQLRALILDLAVRGRLLPRQSGDEPAARLLPKMAADRQRRVAAREIKSTAIPSKIAHEPFGLPEGWEWIPLGQTGNIFIGNSVNASVRAELGLRADGRPFVATKDVGYGLDPIDYENGLCVARDDKRFVVAKPNSVFICAEGGSAGRKIAISDREICFGNKLFANEPWEGVNSKFVLYVYLSSYFFECFSSEMTGIIGGISRANFLALPFPLPPIAEQNRIVAKVDELMALCNALERASADGLELHKALVETLLTTIAESVDGESLAASWAQLEGEFDALIATEESVEALKDLVVELAVTGALTGKSHVFPMVKLKDALAYGPKNGYSPPSVDFETDVKTLALSATTQGVFNGEHFKYVDIASPSPESELWLKANDILVQRADSMEHVGVSALYNGPDNEFIYPDLMMKIRFIESIDERFAVMALNSRPVRTYLRSNASGTSGSMPKINHKTLLNITIPLPPLQEQHRIVAKVDELMALCDHLRRGIADANETRRRLADAAVEKVAA